MSRGFHPIDSLRAGFQNTIAHPFQAVGRGLAGVALGPVGGLAARQFFNMYNNRQNQSAANLTNDRTVSQGNQAAARGFDKPLDGPLGNVPEGHGDNSALANALAGVNFNSGPSPGQPNTWNMSQAFGNNPSNSAELVNSLLANVPNGQRPDFNNSAQAGGNLGLGGTAMFGGHGMMPTAGYSQAGGGYGAGVMNGGGGMHSFQVNSGSLSPSNYGGIGGGGGQGYGPGLRPLKKPA